MLEFQILGTEVGFVYIEGKQLTGGEGIEPGKALAGKLHQAEPVSGAGESQLQQGRGEREPVRGRD